MNGEREVLHDGVSPADGPEEAAATPAPTAPADQEAEKPAATDLPEAPADGTEPRPPASGNGPREPADGNDPPDVPRNAAAARAVVTRLLEAWFHGQAGEGPAEVVLADALLVTSELVTNAVRHGGGLTGFTAEITDDGLLLTVADASPEAPVVTERDPATAPIGGYGWPLVRRLTEWVSVRHHLDGKDVVALIALV
ncbi:ATP-binding protein [Streptomyces sp. NPDC006516]|uniref:ATP-binding protein n=1 Tax=Streptomyces sp. NPDC006516 TaxID=3154309 RepID=UPI0033A449EF